VKIKQKSTHQLLVNKLITLMIICYSNIYFNFPTNWRTVNGHELNRR